jgi:hypothetical protein
VEKSQHPQQRLIVHHTAATLDALEVVVLAPSRSGQSQLAIDGFVDVFGHFAASQLCIFYAFRPATLPLFIVLASNLNWGTFNQIICYGGFTTTHALPITLYGFETCSAKLKTGIRILPS